MQPMTTATVHGLSISYEVIGEGRPWVITPGGRFSKDYGGVRELAEAIAAGGNQVLIWDRPNTGASDVCFSGESESQMQADVLAGLLRELDMAPAVIAGGSGGSRVSLLAARQADVASALAVWWISGGVLGQLTLGYHYCADSIRAAWNGGMEAVVALPEWQEVLDRNPGNRARFLALDPTAFIETMERWMLVYCPCDDDTVLPGLSAADAAAMDLPTLVFRSGESDVNHPRATSEAVVGALPNTRLVEPPWGDREWLERQAARAAGEDLFERWPLLAPTLLAWADEVLA